MTPYNLAKRRGVRQPSGAFYRRTNYPVTINPILYASEKRSLKTYCYNGEKRYGLPRSKTLAHETMTHKPREASWTAPALWRFL